MRTIGIDLAVEPRKTGIAAIDWSPDGSGTATARTGADDNTILELLLDSEAHVIGFDVPLGWPTRFVEMIVAHHDYSPIKADSWDELYGASRLRATDYWLHETCGANPMPRT